jgi:LmbE family N-acetylglucosaminyl deacetylase
MDSLFERVVVIGAHYDDPEYMAGGLLSRLADEGKGPIATALSDSRGCGRAYIEEVDKSMKILGATFIPPALPSPLGSGAGGTQSFHHRRRDIVEHIYQIKDEYSPTLVVTHQFGDSHQDHEVIREEVVRIFKNRTAIMFSTHWWNDTRGRLKNFFVGLTEGQAKDKVAALHCYESQIVAGRDYFDPAYILAAMKVVAMYTDKPYAEAFELFRLSI